jgi:hypothetical protein
VKLSLPKALRRLLQRKGELSLRVTAKIKDQAGPTRTIKEPVKPRLTRTPKRSR